MTESDKLDELMNCRIDDGRKIVEPCTVVIFGASGDLTARKLIPALYHLFIGKQLPSPFRIIGFARREKTDDQWRTELRTALDQFSRTKPVDNTAWTAFAKNISYCIGDFSDASAFGRLKDQLATFKDEKLQNNLLFYLATPPSQFAEVVEHLHNASLLKRDNGGFWQRLVVEKPFGHDFESAVKLNDELTRYAHEKQVYRIDEVFVYPNYELRAEQADTLKSYAQYHKGYYVVDRNGLYKPRLFEESMQFYPNDLYNRDDHNKTISRLVNLNLFKFVKNRFEPVFRNDSTKLDVYYYLTPFPKKSLRGEVNASTKSNSLTGSSITLGWRNRNTFRGGELLTLDGTIGSEVQVSGQMKGFNTYRIGGEIGLIIPRFLSPFHISNRGGFVPRTNFRIGYELLTKQKLYTMQSFRLQFGYNWKESFQKEHEFNLVSINYVQPLLITDLYEDSAANDRTLLKAIERQFILGTNYNFRYNQMQGRPVMSQGMYFNGNIDLSGNIAGLVTGANAKENKAKNLFNAPFSQYLRFESDYRYYFKLAPTMVWANRVIAGIGIPYGNSLQLPYIKQFFCGRHE